MASHHRCQLKCHLLGPSLATELTGVLPSCPNSLLNVTQFLLFIAHAVIQNYLFTCILVCLPQLTCQLREHTTLSDSLLDSGSWPTQAYSRCSGNTREAARGPEPLPVPNGSFTISPNSSFAGSHLLLSVRYSVCHTHHSFIHLLTAHMYSGPAAQP